MSTYAARAYEVGAAWMVEAIDVGSPLCAVSHMLIHALEDLRRQIADFAGEPVTSVLIRLAFEDPGQDR